MKKRTREVIFLIFFIGFLIAAPIVVLYTAGYRYNFGTGQIVQTGVLSLSSTPKNAVVSLDGNPTRASTPILLKNILPGNHRVRVEKAGYSAWEKNLAVESRSTTFADDIVLFLETDPSLLRETSLTTTRFHSETGRAAYARTEGQWTEIWTYDPKTTEETLVNRISTDSNARVELDWPRADSSVLSIRTVAGGKTTVAYVDANTGNALDSLPDSDVDLSVLTDRVAVSRRDEGTASNVILAYVPLGSYELKPSPDGIVMLEDAVRRRVVLVRADGGDQPILLNANASFWEWEPNGKRLLYSDGFDLHVYDASTHTDTTITRLSSAVTGVAWYPAHATVLYAQADAVYAAELDHRDGRNTVRLVTGTNLGIMHVQDTSLYFFGTLNEKSGLFARVLDR